MGVPSRGLRASPSALDAGFLRTKPNCPLDNRPPFHREAKTRKKPVPGGSRSIPRNSALSLSPRFTLLTAMNPARTSSAVKAS